jgi:hypothetical protein
MSGVELHEQGTGNFLAGEPVIVLYQGLYNGMPGHFVGMREDPNWADIEEGNGKVHPQPVLWLRHPADLPH